ncbi:DUF4242 domain-containing protein [Rhizobium cauense]|uniref:nickel-binding protein n=1 Tax=Rhizobium cauense TaxID=1166683 RepID=UPI00055CFA6D|nr:DUF4242 domain-containing protein [Rhizobium cauense]
MAIFMDRHDLAATTAEDIAEAHRKDLAVERRYGVRFLTYWYDQHRGTAFCLIDAPDAETAQCVHREAHGFVAGEVVEVALSAVEAFLGRITEPEQKAGQTSVERDAGHRAIMFTDIVSSTEMTSRLGDRMAAELIRAHDAIVRRCLEQCEGREVKHTGDGIMASFVSTRAAVGCAMSIQREFRIFNAGTPEPIHVRIGLDCGEPIEDSRDLFGSTVQLAARLCAAADSDQILVSENIFREHGASELFANATRRDLKGFSKPVLAFECEWTETEPR